ncbi:OV-16 antigen [Psilocybe cubensis]|uniref:OV-16 antigen n=1 Tax=Psilocybe cubensis TaxID=181762 RepID=A0ACB8GLT0_PSICU|nr:OV-16 antigen [Psilocybe cubensis]KAH9476658.1 OV-16 antigen [Psilocybe cubensis]
MTDTQVTDCIKHLKSGQVIPDVIPASSTFAPNIFFSVVWPSNGTEVKVPGSTVPRDATINEPRIRLLPTFVSNDEARYTLVMTDPDAPSRKDPKFGQWRHWIVSGLSLPTVSASSPQGEIIANSGLTITPYYPPEPPAGSGLHRYEPPEGVSIPDNAIERKAEPGSRSKWDAMKFAHQCKLKLVGVNFFETEVNAHV